MPRLINIYHCCIPHTGERVLRRLFEHLANIGRTEMEVADKPYDLINERHTDQILFPFNTIVSPLYIDIHSFRRLNKPDDHKTVVVVRHPLDVIFEYVYCDNFNSLSDNKRGVTKLYCNAIANNTYHKQLDAMLSWADSEDNNCMIVKFESLMGDNYIGVINSVLNHLQVPVIDGDIKVSFPHNKYMENAIYMHKHFLPDKLISSYHSDNVDALFKLGYY